MGQKIAFSAELTMHLNDLNLRMQDESFMCMLIVAGVLHHNLGINGLSLSHLLLGKLIFLRLARRTLKSHQCAPGR